MDIGMFIKKCFEIGISLLNKVKANRGGERTFKRSR